MFLESCSSHTELCFFLTNTSVPLIMFLDLTLMFHWANHACFPHFYLYHLESRWRNSRVIGLSWLLTKPPFGSCAIYFHHGVRIYTYPFSFGFFHIQQHPHQHSRFDPLEHPLVTSMQRARFPRDVTTERPSRWRTAIEPLLFVVGSVEGWKKGWDVRCVEGWLGEDWRFVDEKWKVDFKPWVAVTPEI